MSNINDKQFYSGDELLCEDELFDNKCIKKFNDDRCFISTHSQIITINQLCDDSEVTYFEDLTPNHNKVFVKVTSQTTPPCFITMIFETKDGNRIEEEIRLAAPQLIPAAQRIFQIEDLQRIAVICQGDTGGLCRGTINIEKTFCICCRKESPGWGFRRLLSDLFNKKVKEENCFIGSNVENILQFVQPCDGTKITYFKDFSNNHNKTLIDVRANPGNCTVIVSIKTLQGRIIQRRIPANSNRGFQVKDVREIAIECAGPRQSGCIGNIGIQKTFCICCEGDDCFE